MREPLWTRSSEKGDLGMHVRTTRVIGVCLFGLHSALSSMCCTALILNTIGNGADGESKSLWYSKTEFAAYWRDLTESYPMMTNICVNGGVIAMIVSFLRLQSHGKAVALEESAEGKKKK